MLTSDNIHPWQQYAVSIGDVPELLECIFQYLSQRTLRNRVRFVNKLWNSTCQRYIDVIAHCTHPASIRSLVDLETQLQRANVLQCSLDSTIRQHSDCSLKELSERVTQALEPILALDQRRFHTLIVEVELGRLSSITPFHSLLHLVTNLHIQATSLSAVHLGTILRRSPQLLSLSLQPATNLSIQPATSRQLMYARYDSAPFPSPLLLRSLVLRDAAIPVAALQAITTHCPRLNKLHLIDLRAQPQPYSEHYFHYRESTYIESFLATCPSLRSFHFTIHGTMIPPKFFRALSSQVPQLESWSTDHANSCTWMLRDISKVWNRLTTLTIRPGKRGPLSVELHNFLCHAPQLLHLYASQEAIPFTSVRLEPLEVGKKIWACRRLKTLRISFMDSTPATGVMDGQAHESNRWLFAYLTVVCPQLSDLSIEYSLGIDCKLEAGFSLLSALHELERLEIRSKSSDELSPINLVWMAATHRFHLSEMQSLNHDYILSRMRSVSSSWYNTGRESADAGALVGQIRQASLPLSIAERVDLLTKKTLSWPAWPRLEQLCIRKSIHSQMSLHNQQLLHDLRPTILIAPLKDIE
ncbi:hypothetical protein BG005_008541 [Podila minutissima]|nr:hypothetical protein BG005_008541 [Podila minutissima]